MQQVSSSSHKKIKLLNSDLPCIVDARDYEWLSSFDWSLKRSKGCISVSRRSEGRTSLMHQEVFRRHSKELCTHLSHRNGNKIDNRYYNLVPRYGTGTRQKYFHASNKLRDKLNSLAPVLAIAKNGVVHHHSLAGVIERSKQEIDLLLCQRLKAAQLVIESRNELFNCKAQLIKAVSEIDNAIAALEQTISAMQP